MLGQLQDKVSTKALASTLKDTREHPMVRHEAAEALGSIAGIAFMLWLIMGLCNPQSVFLFSLHTDCFSGRLGWDLSFKAMRDKLLEVKHCL